MARGAIRDQRSGVFIEGLDDFRRELRRANRDLAKQVMVEANVEVAEAVIEGARTKARGVGRQQARAIETLRSARKQRAAVVRLGRNTDKWAWTLGAEFGAKAYPQFPPWRGNDENAGYFLYPTIREKSRDEIPDIYLDAIVEAFERAFPEQRGMT